MELGERASWTESGVADLEIVRFDLEIVLEGVHLELKVRVFGHFGLVVECHTEFLFTSAFKSRINYHFLSLEKPHVGMPKLCKF